MYKLGMSPNVLNLFKQIFLGRLHSFKQDFLLQKLAPDHIAVIPFSTSQQCCCCFMFTINVQQNGCKL